MNYEKLYYRIINNRKLNPAKDVYTETHHIKPKCLGGNDKKINLVNLTAREHFLCHYCLVKMFEKGTNEYHKMLHAFILMKAGTDGGLHKGQRYLNSRLYESLKKEYSKVRSKQMKGKGNNQYGKCWIMNLEKEESKCITKDKLETYLNDGWTKGRSISFTMFINNFKLKQNKTIKISELEIYLNKGWKKGKTNFKKLEEKKHKRLTIKPKKIKQKKEFRKKNRIKKEIIYNKLYKIYINNTVKDFIKITKWNTTIENFLGGCKRYVNTYKTNSSNINNKKEG